MVEWWNGHVYRGECSENILSIQGRRKGEKSGMAYLPRAELWDPRRGSPTAGGPGNFLNLDYKSLILSTSRGDTNYQQTEYFYGF